MKKFISKIKESLSPDVPEDEDGEDEYVELDTTKDEFSSKITVRPFSLQDFSDVKDILTELREGHTIALVNIKPLKDQDLVELKRAINKLKKTCDAIDGEVAGFGDDWIVAVPAFAKIHRGKEIQKTEIDE